MKLLTYNLGLLDVTVMGIVLFSNPEYSRSRLPYAIDSLRVHDADIICLQEVYTLEDSMFLINNLRYLYPYSSRIESKTWLPKPVQNGLLILSKYPIINQQLKRFDNASTLELWVANKSILSVTVDVPECGKLSLITTHTTAGGEADPEHPETDDIRFEELKELRSIAEKCSQDEKVVIIGDLNCGPEASKGNYEYILEWTRDAFAEAFEKNKWSSSTSEPFTWDPANRLNRDNVHAHCPKQRVDHVMLSQLNNNWDNWSVSSASIVLSECIVPVVVKDTTGLKTKEMVTLSDHYGLLVTLDKSP